MNARRFFVHWVFYMVSQKYFADIIQRFLSSFALAYRKHYDSLINSSLASSSLDKFDRELRKYLDSHKIGGVFMYLA